MAYGAFPLGANLVVERCSALLPSLRPSCTIQVDFYIMRLRNKSLKFSKVCYNNAVERSWLK